VGDARSLPAPIASIEMARQQRDEWTGAGKTVVLTNGCFDLLHVGHIRYLAAARDLGDRLIVAMDDDESVRQLKGADRPLVPLEQRAEVLASLRSVDLVVPFEGPGASDVVRELRPDVYVKGGDYDALSRRPPEADVAEECGGRVVFVPFAGGHSTSSIVERIRRM
jgi:rfaE bifunctional protein nucleotidyltransferase chain/domain